MNKFTNEKPTLALVELIKDKGVKRQLLSAEHQGTFDCDNKDNKQCKITPTY